MLLVRHDSVWLTAQDLSDITTWSPALEVVCPALDQIVQMAPGLRATYQLPVARLNQAGVTRFKVARTFSTYWAAEAFAHGVARTASAEGLAEFFVVNFADEVQAKWTQADAALRVAPPVVNGTVVIVEYEISGGEPVVVEDLTGALVGTRNMTATFLFPGQLRAGQIGGSLRVNTASAISVLDLSLDAPADAAVSGELVDGDGASIGVTFAIAASQRVASITLDPEVFIASGSYVIPRLLSVGSASEPGQNLLLIATLRQ
jgi:hypothetical protein